MMAASWLLKRTWILLLMTVMAVNSQLDTCGEGRCQNGGQCVETQNGPVCDCQNGFTGASCETNVDDCSFPAQHECQNNAVCVDGVGNYTCTCLSGWEGTYCEQEKDECMSQPCKNNGNCTDEFDGFHCDCPESFTGPTCTQDINECLNTSLCRNGATCQNEIGSFSCLCVPGYTGQLCDKEIDECESSPCYFGGSCIDLINNFRCECLDGFLGPRCQGVVRQCQLNSPCGQNGICVEKPQGGYQCFCKPGYYGSHCDFEANLCASSPCKNGGSCTNFGVNYTCSCKAGFKGKNCETDIQECASAPCQNNGTCSEPVPNGFVCQCQPGYTGSACQTEINECNSNPCHGRQACVDLINAYRCECPLGTTGALCETDIFDCRLTQCLNGGTCTQESDAHICLCLSPFTDQTCSTSMDPCVPSPCLYSGTCFRNGTGFGCVCADGYIGHRCEADVYDCLSNPCLNGGTCEEVLSNGDIQNNRVKFVCRCPAGFTGVLCEMEFVACMSSPCRHGATCISMGVEDYSCECTSGWRGDQCDRDINECLQTPPICLNGGQCINLTPGFKCVCPQQWTGSKCEVDIAGCAILTCLNGGTCVEGLGTPSRCQCSVGFTGSDCSVRLSSCEPNPCHNNATCNDVANVGAGLNFTCQCLPGYTGPLCEGNIDECTVLKPCLNNATCLDEINGFTCDCIAGWTGATCDEDIDECVSSPCMNGGTCTDLPGGFHCECPLGFSGSTCSQEQSDCVYEPCRNNATCVDLVHGFKCECPPGFTGLACSIDIDECASFPCANRSTCVDGTNNFTCVCPPGFQGEFCEEDIQECSPDPCKNGGTCSEPVPGTYSCLCLPGVEGDNCDLISTATFGAGKSLTFPQLAGLYVGETSRRKRQAVETVPSDGISIQLQFTFTTSVLKGILLVATGVSSTGQPQHIAIELQDSILHLSANNGIQRLEETIDLKIQGSEIHSHVVALTFGGINVDLQLDPNTCNSSVDNCTCSTRLLFADETAWNLNGPVHFGGVKDFTPYLRHIVQDVDSFTGCLGNLMVNGQAVNLVQATEFSSMNNSSKVSAPSYGCPTHTPCQQDTCSDGGVCRDMWTHLTCDCLPGFTDARCSRQYMAHFEEDSMLHFEGNYRISDISFTFSSANSSGLLFYTVTADALCISLDSGQIRMQLIPVSGARDISSRVGSNLQLEDWVKVSLRFLGNQYTLEVSSNKSGSLGSVMGTAGAYILVTGPLFVGALHDHTAMDKWRGRDPPLPTDRSIQGCIRDVMVNNTDLDLATSVPTSLGNDPPMARPGCGKEEACLDNPCANQGECLPQWEGPVCQCGEGYTGDDCSQVSSATFDGNVSHSSIQLDRALEPFGESGKIEFRTRQTTSTVMLLQFISLDGSFGNFIEFRVYTGRLQVYSGFSKDTAESVSEVSDGQWHTLTWVRDSDYFDLLLDGAALYLQAGFDPFDASLSNMVDIYIGARPFFPGNSSAMVGYFRGCMRDISFNDVTVQYASAESSHPGLTIDPVFLLEGCEGDRMCYLNPCPPNSYCVEDWDSYTCPCLDGWEGPACADSIDDCGNHSCKNAGVCVDGHLSYTCDCGESFTGQYCETFVRACGDNDNPCHPNNTNFCLAVNGTEYLCTCLPGYTGQLCDVLIDSCDSTPCLNGATCIDGDSNFVCICPQGFSGDLCEVRDFCFSQPCYNGGTCVISNSNAEENFSTNSPSSNGSAATVSLPYTCQCVRPYIGSQCQTFDYCDGHLCQNNATCVLNVTKYTCKCDQDHYGTYCEYVDYCAAKPCLNNGDCRNNGDTYTCLCSFYYTGRNCETPVNQCKYDVCFNGATCVFNESAMVTSTSSSSVSSSFMMAASLSPPSSSSNMTEDFTYCICVEGYTGENCETDINECDSSPCLNNGTCEDSTTINPPGEFFSGFRCICAPGFYGIKCEEEVNECNSTLCHNEGECIDLVNGYTCNCSSGFTGQNCEVDMRGCASSPCLNEAECEGYGDNFTCVCRPGFTGDLCEENVDDCEGIRCINGGTCQDGENSYTCDCLPGYSGQFCEDIIDSCYSQPCFNAGVCSYTGVCSCADVVMACGWSDETCQRQRCAERQECNILSSSYICNCTGTGYKKPQCAQDLNECELPNNPCQHSGVCVNTVGSYTCNCRGTGFHGDSCEIDDDECEGQNPCYNGGTCINTAGSYECQCLPEWSGERCGENRNDCNPNPCLNQGSCEDRLGGYVCNCDGTGFEGTNCTDNVDDCANHRCEHGAQCVDGTRQYTCVCDGTGYTGQFCETELGSCVPNPCQHNGTCSEVKSAIMCDCSGTGYHGNFCEFDVDECTEGGNKCQEKGTCVNVAGAYRCECGDARTGEFCESALVQEQAEKSDLSEGAVAALIVLAFAILIVIALVAIWQVQRRRKTHGVYKPAEMEGRLRNGDIPMDRMSERVI